ncbi:MAG TPA: hypothetical protein VGP30_06840, partial [Candidatus Limnocylindrales bacterium]|nr:hypothetical protein [Candidatus Limnocylindrales bacterium]
MAHTKPSCLDVDVALTRQWVRGEITWWQARTAAGTPMRRLGISMVPLGMLRTLPVRRLQSGMWPHTNSVLLLTRSRRYVQLPLRARPRALAGSS